MSNKRYKTFMQNFSVKKPRRSVYRDRVRRYGLINKKNSFNRVITDKKSIVQSKNANKIACVEILEEDLSCYCELNIIHLFH